MSISSNQKFFNCYSNSLAYYCSVRFVRGSNGKEETMISYVKVSLKKSDVCSSLERLVDKYEAILERYPAALWRAALHIQSAFPDSGKLVAIATFQPRRVEAHPDVIYFVSRGESDDA